MEKFLIYKNKICKYFFFSKSLNILNFMTPNKTKLAGDFGNGC